MFNAKPNPVTFHQMKSLGTLMYFLSEKSIHYALSSTIFNT